MKPKCSSDMDLLRNFIGIYIFRLNLPLCCSITYKIAYRYGNFVLREAIAANRAENPNYIQSFTKQNRTNFIVYLDYWEQRKSNNITSSRTLSFILNCFTKLPEKTKTLATPNSETFKSTAFLLGCDAMRSGRRGIGTGPLYESQIQHNETFFSPRNINCSH
jgi:hypothetical protein